MMKLLFIVGSLRKNSFNKTLAEIASQDVSKEAEVMYADCTDIPIFNQDTEWPTPASVERVRQQCLDADGIWFFCPEYNLSIPGGLKNLLDWLSRPLEKGTHFTNTALYGKPACISGIGGSTGTKEAQEQLQTLLQFLGMKVMPLPSCRIALPGSAFGADAIPEDIMETARKLIFNQAEAFTNFIPYVFAYV